MDPRISFHSFLNWLGLGSCSIGLYYLGHLGAEYFWFCGAGTRGSVTGAWQSLAVVSRWPLCSADTRGVFATPDSSRFTVFELLIIGQSVPLLVYFLTSFQPVVG